MGFCCLHKPRRYPYCMKCIWHVLTRLYKDGNDLFISHSGEAAFLFSIFCRVQDHRTFGFQWTHFALLKIIENRTEKNCIKPY